MTDGVWKGVYPYVFGRAKQLLKDKFFDPSTPSLRKGKAEKTENTENREKKRLMRIVATTLLPVIDRPNADRWNAHAHANKVDMV